VTRARGVGAFVLGAAFLRAWWTALDAIVPGGDYGFGSINLPTPITLAFSGMFVAFAVWAVPLWTMFLRAFWPKKESRLSGEFDALTEAKQVAFFSFLAFAGAALVREFVLGHSPLTDDESVYEFGAKLLASGRLWVHSPEPRLFFDNVFLINDGRYYGQYPMGWPALLMIGVVTGLKGLVNPLLSAATVPAIYGLGDRLGGPRTARWSAFLFVVSPMLATGAATLMSHTSALAFSCWLLWVVTLRIDRKSAGWDALVAFLFAGLIFIRPMVGVGLGTPALFWWFKARMWPASRQRVLRSLAFLAVGVSFGGLFLAVNHAQTGSMWKLAYARSLEYAQENHYRFSAWLAPERFMSLGPMAERLEVFAAMVLRMNADLFGFPLSLLPLAFVRWSRGHALLVVSLLFFVAIHVFARDVGIDTFAPVHIYEAAGPLIVLCAHGLSTLETELPTLAIREATVAFFLVGWASIVPMRLVSLFRLARDARAPAEFVEGSGISNAVVFPIGIPLRCSSATSRHFVFARPNNSPDMDDDVIWANHLTIASDRELMRTRFPGRAGFVLAAQRYCLLTLVPIDSLAPDAFPPSINAREPLK